MAKRESVDSVLHDRLSDIERVSQERETATKMAEQMKQELLAMKVGIAIHLFVVPH